MGMYDTANYELRFYSSEGYFKSDWPVYAYKITCTYIQAEEEAKRVMRNHPNWYTYTIVKK